MVLVEELTSIIVVELALEVAGSYPLVEVQTYLEVLGDLVEDLIEEVNSWVDFRGKLINVPTFDHPLVELTSSLPLEVATFNHPLVVVPTFNHP